MEIEIFIANLDISQVSFWNIAMINFVLSLASDAVQNIWEAFLPSPQTFFIKVHKEWSVESSWMEESWKVYDC